MKGNGKAAVIVLTWTIRPLLVGLTVDLNPPLPLSLRAVPERALSVQFDRRQKSRQRARRALTRRFSMPRQGVDHIVEVAFGANIDADVEMLKTGGSIGAYATYNATPKIPFRLMVFKNIRLYFLGSDDFPAEAKVAATRDLSGALQAGWAGFEIGERIPLPEIARAHELGGSSSAGGGVYGVNWTTQSDEGNRPLP